MAIIDEEDFLNQTFSVLPSNEPIPEGEDPEATAGISEATAAFFKSENPFFGIARSFADPDTGPIDPSFDPFTDENLAGYEDRVKLFVDVKNSFDMNLRKFQIDYEDEQKEILRNASGWTTLTAGLGSALVDPTILIPGVAGIKAISRTGRFVQGSMQGTALGLAAGTGREAVLQATSATRLGEESIENILAESAFGGILGGAIGGLSKGARSAGKQMLAQVMEGEEFRIAIDKAGKPSVARNAGAAEVNPRAKLDEEGLAFLNETLAKNLASPIPALRSPIIRGITSRFTAAREFTNNTYIHNLIIGKETAGVARTDIAEALVRQDEAVMIDIHAKVTQMYADAFAGGSRFRAAIGKNTGAIGFQEFQSRIARGLRDDKYVDTTPQVNESVKLYRAHIDRLSDQMIELEILPKNLSVELRRNYLTRIYDTKKMLTLEGRKGFLKRVSGWLRTRNKDGTLRNTPLDETDAQSQAMSVYDNIMGEGEKALAGNQFAADVISKGRFTKERALLMPDKLLEEWLVNDAQQLVSVYTKKASAAIHMQNSLKKQGFDNLGELVADMQGQKERLLSKATNNTERTRIQKDFNDDAQLVTEGYAAMMGALGKPRSSDKWFERIRAYQFTRMLGGVTVSSFPDFAMAPFVLGLKNTLIDGYLPMIRNYKASKLSKDQYRDIDVGLEAETNNVLRYQSDTTIELGRVQTDWDRHIDSITDVFGKVSGISYYTAFGRRMAAHVGSADIVRTLTKFQKGEVLSAKEVTRLANMGISKADYGRIVDQFRFSEKISGSFISNTHLWQDPEAAKIFKGAVQRIVESVIIKPSIGDIPIIAQQSQLARTIFQFKSFGASATNKLLLSSLQRRDSRTLLGLFMLVGVGSLSGITKDKIAGRDSPDTLEEHVFEGVTRSGILGLMLTIPLDFTKNLMNQRYRRYAGTNAIGQVLGPSSSTIREIGDLAGRLADGDVSNSDIRAALRLIPFNNLFYIQSLTNQALSK